MTIKDINVNMVTRTNSICRHIADAQLEKHKNNSKAVVALSKAGMLADLSAIYKYVDELEAKIANLD